VQKKFKPNSRSASPPASAEGGVLDKTRVNTLEGVKLPVITKVVVTKSYMVWESPRLAKNPHIKRGYPGCT